MVQLLVITLDIVELKFVVTNDLLIRLRSLTLILRDRWRERWNKAVVGLDIIELQVILCFLAMERVYL